ncbi:hypothetical protein C882_0543 [Caenispirillum salinarum AK4]|uniref:Lysozyme inhibitor LprI-like N-terminal domain-containing protein n=1 Tax=Caenispirillum salinarum AK4 TaxID=1238182 RepID=K9HKZ4_9PROT|nr:lysozyme inhibitor LprI family protein [Caenispirillum salinarum]EKV29236.1 hypothetical protein C882_0543 [Caenispirillum salinarum AK4]
MRQWKMVALAGGFAVLAALAVPAGAVAQDDGLTEKYGACMDASGGVTINMKECIWAEHERQDARLNAAYKHVMGLLSDDRKAALRTAQRAWIAYRDANCGFFADPMGGTLAGVLASDCMMSETAERARELEDIASMY